MVTRPAKPIKGDWASKVHIALYPVYYQNYMMGELLAAQMRNSIKLNFKLNVENTIDWSLKKPFGQWLIKRLFVPGMSLKWGALIKQATGKTLSSKAFSKEVK